MILNTKRTILRRFKSTDLDPLVSMMTDAEVMKYTGFKVPQTSGRINELLQKWAAEDATGLGVWAAEEIQSGEFIGWFMLKETVCEDPEIGFMIPRHLWNKGYASEVSEKFLEYAFADLDKNRVIASTDMNNSSSIRVLEKIGMVKSENIASDKNVIYFEKMAN